MQPQTRTAFNTNNTPRTRLQSYTLAKRDAARYNNEVSGRRVSPICCRWCDTFGKGRFAANKPPCPAFYSVFVSLPSIIKLPHQERNYFFRCLFPITAIMKLGSAKGNV
jgi:hypothetical protein